MKKPPFIKLFIKDFAFETNLMTNAQIGKHMRELLEAYRTGKIPENLEDFSLFLALKKSNASYEAICKKNKQNRNISKTYSDQSSTTGQPLVNHSLTTLVKPEPEPEPDITNNNYKNNYYYNGSVIKLNEKDYKKWEEIYYTIDLKAYLESRDSYLKTISEEQRKKWFVSTSRDLENRHNNNRNNVGKLITEDSPEITMKGKSFNEMNDDEKAIYRERYCNNGLV